MSAANTISVVTICYNNLAELQKTVASVDMQHVLPFEHIIIDGSSTDEIRQYLSTTVQPDYRRWLSERDNGIADAFNKGVKLATGNLLNMLNAGDTYQNQSVLEKVVRVFDADPDLMWLHGMFQLKRGGLWVTIGKAFDPELLYRGMRSLSHQSMFIKRQLHDSFGYYDLNLKNAMDYDFVCRIAGQKFAFIPKPFVIFAPDGTTDTDYSRALAEGKKVYIKHFGTSWKLTLWQLRLKLLRSILNGPFGKAIYKIKVEMGLANA